MIMRLTDPVGRPQGRSLRGSHSLSVDCQFVGSYLGTNWTRKPAEIQATEQAIKGAGVTVA